MPIEKGERFAKGDLFIDYPFEDVMYRWDHLQKSIFVKFYGEPESPHAVPHDNRLFTDALLYGDEISREDYSRGKSSSG
jgi:hypothetical protein